MGAIRLSLLLAGPHLGRIVDPFTECEVVDRELFHVAPHETACYPLPVLRGQDILILLELCNDGQDATVRSIGEPLGLDPASVHRALRRLREVGLIDGRRRVNKSNVREYLLHAWKYSFPPKQSGLTRGVPTAWAATPLKDLLAPSKDEPPPVWPHPKGKVRGVGIEPVHGNVPDVALRNPLIAEELALLDGIRLGDARIRELASKKLVERLMANEDRAR